MKALNKISVKYRYWAIGFLTLTISMPGFSVEKAIYSSVYHVETSGALLVNGKIFSSRYDFLTSEYFRVNGLRCGTPPLNLRP
jgi:hypothetical protein